jgi:hypothetical protein
MRTTVLVSEIVASLEKQVAKERADHTKAVAAWPKEDRRSRMAVGKELRTMAVKVESGAHLKTTYGRFQTLRDLPTKPAKNYCSRTLNELTRWERDVRTKVSLDSSDFSRIFPQDSCR